LLHILLVLAWSVLAFEVVRALLAWRWENRRLGGVIAFAIAGAVFLGATARFVSSGMSLGALPVASGAPVVPQPAGTAPVSRRVACPRSARVASNAALGAIDGVQIGQLPATPNGGNVELPRGSDLRLVGWGVLNTGPGFGICAIVDGHPVPGPASYGGARPDVAAALRVAADVASGYSIPLQLSIGEHQLGIGVVESDGLSVDPVAIVVHATVR
jgi:hypothetical protein